MNLWIPIEKKLPPYRKSVLVSDGKEVGLCCRMFTDEDGEHFCPEGQPDVYWLGVIEWMEVPKPTPRGKR